MWIYAQDSRHDRILGSLGEYSWYCGEVDDAERVQNSMAR